MFKDAGAMWSSVEALSRSLSPVSAVAMLQKREVISGIVAVNSHDLHAAGDPRQGSETPSCSGPAHNAPRGRRMLRFPFDYR
jgi:hypothetical protein